MIKVICYGAGADFKRITQRFDYNKVNIVAVIDKNWGNIEIGGACLPDRILPPTAVCDLEFDYVVICSSLYCVEMAHTMLANGVGVDKIVFFAHNPNVFPLYDSNIERRLYYFNCNNEVLSRLFVADAGLYYLVQNTVNIGRERRLTHFTRKTNGDYVRVATLELLAEQIIKRDVKGCVAELGVYQGKFGALINELFPDRKLWLFDTFEGFDDADFKYDIDNNLLQNDRLNMQHGYLTPDGLKKTSVESVLSQMPFKNNVIIKKGYFPATVEGFDDFVKFAFVSLDVDLYLPTYEGLKFFYGRLSKGGYIMVHDYNDSTFGVKDAVDRFCGEQDLTLTPISDIGGSVIIPK